MLPKFGSLEALKSILEYARTSNTIAIVSAPNGAIITAQRVNAVYPACMYFFITSSLVLQRLFSFGKVIPHLPQDARLRILVGLARSLVVN